MMYILEDSLRAVTLAQTDRGVRFAPGTLTLLPAGSRLQTVGDAPLSTMVSVCCAGRIYAVFREDLEARGLQVAAA
jgi:hypothetical protein